MPVAHAVEAGQVGRRLGRRDDVVDRDRQLDIRQRHLDGPCSQRAKPGERNVDRGGDIGIDPVAAVLPRQADAQARERFRGRSLPQQPRIIFRRSCQTGRVARIVARHGIEKQRAILRSLRKGARGVEARRERD